MHSNEDEKFENLKRQTEKIISNDEDDITNEAPTNQDGANKDLNDQSGDNGQSRVLKSNSTPFQPPAPQQVDNKTPFDN